MARAFQVLTVSQFLEDITIVPNHTRLSLSQVPATDGNECARPYVSVGFDVEHAVPADAATKDVRNLPSVLRDIQEGPIFG